MHICETCKTTFKLIPVLEEHNTASCMPRQERNFSDGFNCAQKARIEHRNTGFQKTKLAHWQYIYGILFDAENLLVPTNPCKRVLLDIRIKDWPIYFMSSLRGDYSAKFLWSTLRKGTFSTSQAQKRTSRIKTPLWDARLRLSCEDLQTDKRTPNLKQHVRVRVSTSTITDCWNLKYTCWESLRKFAKYDKIRFGFV